MLAFFSPRTLALLVLIYSIYWLIKIFIVTGHLIVGFFRYRSDIKQDWQQRLCADFPKECDRFYQLVIMPTYKEDISILRRTILALKESNYPTEKLLVVVGFEERDKENAANYAKVLMHENEHTFGLFMTTSHPANIEGEIKGKGPNITWSGRKVKKEIEKRGIPFEDVIVTTIDADNRVDTNYFANLTWSYLNTPDPTHKSFQPLPMFFNNMWRVPLPVKLMALGSSFWQIIQATRPRYSRNFAAHSQSLVGLIETDFWSVTTIVEDGHQYWRSYFAFKGNHHVVPMFVPVYMDAVEGEDLYDTFREQYLQRRRWYWGVSDIPYVFDKTYKNKDIPFFYKWTQFGRLFESHYSLATQSFILLIGWMPLYVNSDFRSSVLGYSFPIVYRFFLEAAWIGMIANMLVATFLVPPRPGSKWSYYGLLLMEWVLSPILFSITAVVFSALPAIDSQTRLMFNRPFTVFNVTKKAALPDGVLTQSEN